MFLLLFTKATTGISANVLHGGQMKALRLGLSQLQLTQQPGELIPPRVGPLFITAASTLTLRLAYVLQPLLAHQLSQAAVQLRFGLQHGLKRLAQILGDQVVGLGHLGHRSGHRRLQPLLPCCSSHSLSCCYSFLFMYF